MDKLIITCATAWEDYGTVEGLNPPQTIEENVDSIAAACDAGAAITHMHAPLVPGAQGPTSFQVEAWRELADAVRQRTDIIYEHGQGGAPYVLFKRGTQMQPSEELRATFDLAAEHPEMIAMLVNEVDFVRPGHEFYILPTRPEIVDYLTLFNEVGVKPAFEVWHSGSYFNLGWLMAQGLIADPAWLTLFFGANGGMSGPATVQELLHRLEGLPSAALWQVAVFCGFKGDATTEDQFNLITHAIALGGHVRVGMEDNPYIRGNEPARSNAEIVERVVVIAKAVGREIASPDEARAMLGLKRPDWVRQRPQDKETK